MCKAGGFKLGKFISNSTMVLMSLQEDKRKNGVKDADLSSGELPVKRAFGVQWNIDEDTFCFKIATLEYPFTCRGFFLTLSSVYNPLDLAAPLILEGDIESSKIYAKETVLGMN